MDNWHQQLIRMSNADFLFVVPSSDGGPAEGPGGGGSGGPVDLRTEPRVGSHSGGVAAVDTSLREQQLQQELVLLKQQQELQKQLLFAEFQKKHEVLTRQHEVQLQEHLKVASQVCLWLVLFVNQPVIDLARRLVQLSLRCMCVCLCVCMCVSNNKSCWQRSGNRSWSRRGN